MKNGEIDYPSLLEKIRRKKRDDNKDNFDDRN